MKNIPGSKILTVAAAGIVAFFISCHFPYQPEPFVLPEIPYKFPSSTEISGFFGTSNVKIAYTLNDNGVRTVYYVDLSDTAPSPKKLRKPAGKENINSDSPLISPDGSFVVYCLLMGNTAYGAYMQKLDPDAPPVLIAANGTQPHWWTDIAGRVFIIYSDQFFASNLVTGIHATYKQQVSCAANGSLTGAAEVIAPYPMNGGVSKDGRYLCTGYAVAAFYDIPSLTLVNIDIGVQVCNPSIDPDTMHPDWMMFLNFAGKQNLNNPYEHNADFPADAQGNLGMHTVLLIVDAGNTVKDYVPISIMKDKNGAAIWQCPEWSNNPNFAAALTLANDNATSGDGVIIKNIGNPTAAKETLIFTRGNGKLNSNSTPCVWIGN